MLDELMTRIVGEVSGERALADVAAVSRFHRVQASPGLDAAADWLAAALERAGYAPDIDHVAGDGRTRCFGQLMPQGWACARATATLHDGAATTRLCDAEAVPLSVVLRSGEARGRWPLTWLAGGNEPEDYAGLDVRGRVLLTEADVHRVHRLGVVERGAAGLLAFGRRLLPGVRDADDELDAVNYTSFWWGEREARGWGFVLAPRVGRALRERLAGGARLELDVDIDARAFDTRIPMVGASLPATGASRREDVIVLSHLCHPAPCANDNASGVAANLETARALRALAGRGALPGRSRGVRFLWMPEFTGTYAWLAAGESRAASLVAGLNLDMVGEDQSQCGSTFLLERPPHFLASFSETLLSEVRATALRLAEAVAGGAAPRVDDVPYSGGSDHSVLVDPGFGVPCPMLIQWPDRFYHSTHDTLDRCDPRSLALAAQCAAGYAAFLAAADANAAAWLLDRVGDEAARRAGAAASPERGRVERRRASTAIASLERLAPGDAAWRRRLQERASRFAPDDTRGRAARADGGTRVPRRRLAAPLHYQRWLIDGYDALPAAERDAWRRLESGPDSLAAAFELAWFACDGRRTLEEIAALVRDESGRDAAEAVGRFFGWTERLGASEWIGGGG